jgi:hypothetical protein
MGGCGNGMVVGLIGKATLVRSDAWTQHQASIWEHSDSPDAEAYFTGPIKSATSWK